ncbi:MAG TPA: flagellar motor switch protein FliM [Stellaceae bacterium]|nr:flagellar motor switch protein FliM [Stellaceae bacterium]
MSEIAPAEFQVRPYDLLAEQQPTLTQMPALGPTLDRVNHRFARHLRAALLQHLRRGVDVFPGQIELVKHKELLERLATPTYLTLVNMKPLRGTLLLLLDAQLVVTIVESRFGGSGRFPVPLTNREFTPFELKSMRRVIEMTLEQYALAWQPLGSYEPDIVRLETNPQFAGFAAADDLVLVTTFDIQIDYGKGKLITCIPYSSIEPINEELTSGVVEGVVESGDTRWSEGLNAGVEHASITLNVELGNIEITVADLVALAPGTVFEMGRPETLTVESGGVPLFRGKWGRIGRKVGVKIEERLVGHLDATALKAGVGDD